MCGSSEFHWVVRDHQGEWRGQKYVVPALGFWECSSCREILFPPAAMDRIAAISPAYEERRKKRNAA